MHKSSENRNHFVYLETSAVTGENVSKLVDVLLSAASVRVVAAANSKASTNISNKVISLEEPQSPLSVTLLSTPTPPFTPPSLSMTNEKGDDEEDDMDDEARQVKAAFDASLVACIESQSVGSDSPRDEEDDDFWPDEDDIDDDLEEGNNGEGLVIRLENQANRNTCAQMDQSVVEQPTPIVMTSHSMQKIKEKTDETDLHSTLNTRDEGKEVDDVSLQDPKKNIPYYKDSSKSTARPVVITSNSCQCTLS